MTNRKTQLSMLLTQLSELFDDIPDQSVSIDIDVELVTERELARRTGYTEAALEGKRRGGKFKEGYHYHIDPDGKPMYELKRIYAWVRGENIPESKYTAKASESGSPTKANVSTKKRSSRRMSVV